MGNTDDEKIDLQSLSQRELLIQVYKNVESLNKTTSNQAEKQMHMEIELAVLKTQVKLWAVIIGFLGGIGSSLLVSFILTALKN